MKACKRFVLARVIMEQWKVILYGMLCGMKVKRMGEPCVAKTETRGLSAVCV